MATVEQQLKTAELMATQFAQTFYTTFDTTRDNLKDLYIDCSLLTFENDTFFGMICVLYAYLCHPED